ncbi:hypothetical protein GGH92_009390, partial [Coemansia sp. RSA 2673]
QGQGLTACLSTCPRQVAMQAAPRTQSLVYARAWMTGGCPNGHAWPTTGLTHSTR